MTKVAKYLFVFLAGFLGFFVVAAPVWITAPRKVEASGNTPAPRPMIVDYAFPEQVKVGALTYKVLLQRPGDITDDAAIDDELLVIYISPLLAPDRRRERLLHEVLHAAMISYIRFVKPHKAELWLKYDPETPYAEHAYIEALSPMLLGVLRDNPRLLQYLASGEPPSVMVGADGRMVIFTPSTR